MTSSTHEEFLQKFVDFANFKSLKAKKPHNNYVDITDEKMKAAKCGINAKVTQDDVFVNFIFDKVEGVAIYNQIESDSKTDVVNSLSRFGEVVFVSKEGKHPYIQVRKPIDDFSEETEAYYWYKDVILNLYEWFSNIGETQKRVVDVADTEGTNADAENTSGTSVSLYLSGSGSIWRYVIKDGSSIGLGDWHLPSLLKTSHDTNQYLYDNEIPDYLPKEIHDEYEKPLIKDAGRIQVLTVSDDFSIEVDGEEVDYDFERFDYEDIVWEFLESFENKDIVEKDLEQLLSKLPKKFSENQDAVKRAEKIVWGDAQVLGNKDDKIQEKCDDFEKFVKLVMGSYGCSYPFYDCDVDSLAYHDYASVSASFTIELKPNEKFDPGKLQLLPLGANPNEDNIYSAEEIVYDGKIIVYDDFNYGQQEEDSFGSLVNGNFDEEFGSGWEMDEDEWNHELEEWLKNHKS
ncbi:MAG: hypothetical protein MJZ24_04665 [Paludibacteraceae bacterium]|nr:hypothetical protein [Paludibacteraceae bacterium]